MSARLHGEEAEQLIQRELAEFAVNSVLWEVIYLAPATGAYWLKTYPHSEYHGGGSPDLEAISSETVFHKFDSEEGWERREIPYLKPGPPLEFDVEIRLTGDRPSFNGDLNGQRPSFNFGGELTACQVNGAPGITRECVGEAIRAQIRLFYTTPAHQGIHPARSSGSTSATCPSRLAPSAALRGLPPNTRLQLTAAGRGVRRPWPAAVGSGVGPPPASGGC